jgi:hypothetical protein
LQQFTYHIEFKPNNFKVFNINSGRKGITIKKAGNSIYPTLTYLKGKDLIEPYKKGTMNGSY